MFLCSMKDPIQTFIPWAICVFLLLVACTNQQETEYPIPSGGSVRVYVVKVKDGDTFDALWKGSDMTVRLAHIDCPELRQSYGEQAKTFAEKRCLNDTVELIISDVDRYGRFVAEVFTQDGESLNLELVKSGLAWHFKRYSEDSLYSYKEIAAQAAEKGLWQQKAPTAPWEWRKNH
jgi:micrococcal nuclease